MQWCCIWTVIYSSDANQDILRIDFGVFNSYIKVAILGKCACIDQFIFRFFSSTTAIFCHQFLIGESALWIFIQRLHIGMRWSIVKKAIIFLDILTMIAF